MRRGNGTLYDVNAQAWFDEVSWASADLLQKQAVSDFIAALKDSGAWDVWDRLWLIANKDLTAGMTCLKSLVAMAPVNAPTFTQWRGVNGNGSSSYVNTNFVPATDGVNYILDDACGIVDVVNNTQESNRLTFSAEEGAARFSISANNGGSFFGNINNPSSPGISASLPNANGALFLLQRNGASAIAAYRDNSLLNSATTTSANSPNIPVFLGARNAGGTSGFSINQFAMLGFGASLDNGQRSALQAARNSLKLAIGW